MDLLFEKYAFENDRSQLAVVKKNEMIFLGGLGGFQTHNLVNVYSLSKIIISLMIIYLAYSKKINLNSFVASYWPEFSQNNKSRISIKDVLYHQFVRASIQI